MADINQSRNEGICIDEEVFFGPVTDKERRIREHFENAFKNENKITGELPKIDENDISRNDSLYASFSVDDSKYDSFDDSLNDDLDKKPQGAKHGPLRKSLDKLKPKKHSFYDSLEDVCSLASNVEKCSISCDVEIEKHVIDDSLKNPPTAANKISCVNEQIHFDDDSLAIVEVENTFDDSLEEFNVLSSIEIEEINDIEIIATENQNVSFKVEETPLCPSRNLFETSVQVIYENKRGTDVVDQEESSGDKNILYDSLSNSDFKDILKDSLDESEKGINNLLKCVSDASGMNIQNSGPSNFLLSIETNEMKDAKCTNSGLKIDENLNFASTSPFDTSVQIIEEKVKDTVIDDPEDLSEDKNALYDSLSNSDLKDIIIDSLEESDNCIINLKHILKAPVSDSQELEQISSKPNILDSSVQIVYDNLQNFHFEENTSNDMTNSELNVLKQSLEDIKYDTIHNDQITIKSEFKDNSLISCADVSKTVTFDDPNAILSDSNSNKSCQGNDLLHAGLSKPDFPVPAVENHNFDKDTFTVDSCQLKLINDNINVGKDLKFELHFEVTVGDKRCKIATEDIKLMPSGDVKSEKNENYPLTEGPSKSCVIKEKGKEVLDSCMSGYENEEHKINVENLLHTDSNENSFCQKQKAINETNVTRRAKTVSQQFSNSDFNFPEYVNDENLLQALDLHDISASFVNESIIQSKDSVIPLNLCIREQDIKKIQMSLLRNESKENFPESIGCHKEKVVSSPSKKNKSKLNCKKTPRCLEKSPSFKETAKQRIPGTKIPVRKVENFAVPTVVSSKHTKQVTGVQSAEKVKKYPQSQTPHSAEKKTPMSTPNKTPHFCKVRNTIFSKVPQIVPSKKYINIQSPVAQYIRNTPGSAKTPISDPVLRDCMNHMHQQLESPYHLYQTAKSGSAKSTKRKV